MSGHAVVVGAGGGIGRALVERLVASGRFGQVHALARREIAIAGSVAGSIDITEEDGIADAAGRIGAEVDCLIVATGMLHAPGVMPERSLRDIDAAKLMLGYRINTIGPALVLKHFTPLLPRERRAAIGLLSARVGSISDNRLGGWYGYRASKAALNMIVKCAAIELRRTRPEAICVALHPGTVDTRLSAPFQRGVPDGKLFTAARSAAALVSTLDGLGPADSGHCFAWDGTVIPA